MPKTKISRWPVKNGIVGFHLTINPQKPSPPSTKIYQQHLRRGIRLSDSELESLLAGRKQGVEAINHALGVLPLTKGLAPSVRLKIADALSDFLLNRSLEAQLSREAPNFMDEIGQRDEKMKMMFQQAPSSTDQRGGALNLLRQVTIGASVTLHF